MGRGRTLSPAAQRTDEARTKFAPCRLSRCALSRPAPRANGWRGTTAQRYTRVPVRAPFSRFHVGRPLRDDPQSSASCSRKRPGRRVRKRKHESMMLERVTTTATTPSATGTTDASTADGRWAKTPHLSAVSYRAQTDRRTTTKVREHWARGSTPTSPPTP